MSNTVIVIDDSATVRQHVGRTLQQAGFTIVEAADGVDGMAAIDSTPGAKVVICDVNMPRMDGLEMLERVKKDPRHAALPVLMLTTEGQPALIERAKKAGAKGWIVKPFRSELLVATVRKITGV